MKGSSPWMRTTLGRLLMAFCLGIAGSRTHQHLSSAVPFESSQDVLRRVRGRRPNVSRPVREVLPQKHAVVEPPEVLDIERCTSCGSFRFKSGWAKMDRDFALSRLLKDAIPVRPPYQRVTFTQVPREEDANNLSLTVKVLGRFEDLETVRDFRIRVRIKPSLCDTCQKQRGRYYEGILQVRGDGRDLTPKEIRTARTLVTARIERSGEADAFVSRVEEGHGGLDFYVSTNALGKALAREIADTFGGSVGSSPKLFGQQEGREVYRV